MGYDTDERPIGQRDGQSLPSHVGTRICEQLTVNVTILRQSSFYYYALG